MKIVLIGYMGSGKTTVGKLLANDLGLSFLDLDTYIENSLKTTIPDIFSGMGEIFFRRKEHEYLKEILKNQNNFVLSTGGGTPCYSNNMDTILGDTENVFYLKVAIPGLVQRLIKEREDRPLVKNIPEEDLPEFIGKHMFERSHFYSKASHTIICDNKEPDTIVQEIKMLLR